MLPALITGTVAAILRSLWIRRSTWPSHWEADATLSVALQGCAVLLMSPWVATDVGWHLHHIFGLWNLQHLLGHICLIAAAAAIIHHLLTRMADEYRAGEVFGRYVVNPLKIGIPLLIVVFITADESYHPDLFSAHVNSAWLAAYWLLLSGLLIYLFGWLGATLLIARTDPRSRPTANMYLAAVVFAAAAAVIGVGTMWIDVDAALPVWLCVCFAAVTFACGSARSWQAKIRWFTPAVGPARHPGGSLESGHNR